MLPYLSPNSRQNKQAYLGTFSNDTVGTSEQWQAYASRPKTSMEVANPYLEDVVHEPRRSNSYSSPSRISRPYNDISQDLRRPVSASFLKTSLSGSLKPTKLELGALTNAPSLSPITRKPMGKDKHIFLMTSAHTTILGFFFACVYASYSTAAVTVRD
jgi:hypothetical protein